MQWYEYKESHPTGGVATILLNRDDILRYMKYQYPYIQLGSDDNTVDYFVIHYNAYKVDTPNRYRVYE